MKRCRYISKKEDNVKRIELKEIIKKSNLSPNLKARLLTFAEELSNGSLDKLLQDIKKKLN